MTAADALSRLIDGWVEDILSLSDAEVIQEAIEAGEDPEAIARDMRQTISNMLPRAP